jgi:hypothetical protein
MLRGVLRYSSLVLALAAAAAPSSAHAVALIHGLGGPADFGPNNLLPNDDGSTTTIDLSSAFPSGLRFFGSTFHSLWLNNNGNVTFHSAQFQYTPAAFPIAEQPMIAPWWADVDTRPGGMPARNEVDWYVGHGHFIATWHNVGYFADHTDLLNDFQLVLVDRSDLAAGDFDVEFRYDRCEWVTGDASGGRGGHGGTPAQAGFDAGNRVDYYAIPGSLTEDIIHVCDRSNVGVPGLWRFEIRNGVVHAEVDPEGGYDPFFEDVCTGRRCQPPELQLEGSAGPCVCTTPGSWRGRAGVAWMVLLGAVLAMRRGRQSPDG